jgi:aldose 1-epimerase
MRIVMVAIMTAFLFCGIAAGQDDAGKKTAGRESAGTVDGKPVYLYTLKNKNGVEAKFTNFGATLISLKVPDAKGNLADIVLGYDDVKGYQQGKSYFGASIGRYGNRIGKATFQLNGKTYNLSKNDGENTLHGGTKGFNKVVWEGKHLVKPGAPALQFTYTSKDGEEGFPGNLKATITYTLTPANELRIDYVATTDKDTVQNLTHHSYFNLAGGGEILNHQLMLDADRFTPVDSGLIPTGELRPVEGTPFDFRKPTAIGARINQADEQLKFGKGYDHNWVLNGEMGKLRLVARVTEPTTGRVMEVSTTEPGIQFYSGNFLNGESGKGGKKYEYRNGFCLETQHFPDSPNQPKFPTTTLKSGKTYRTSTVYRFTTSK